jgi:hypothetical protein
LNKFDDFLGAFSEASEAMTHRDSAYFRKTWKPEMIEIDWGWELDLGEWMRFLSLDHVNILSPPPLPSL